MKNRRRLCAALGCLLAFCLHAGAQENGDWRAASSNAKSVTGDVAFAGEKFSLNFSTFPAAQIRGLKPEEISAVFDVAADAGGRGNLFRVSIPGSKKFLHKNTLCGSEDTQWVLTYANGRSLELAFFSGAGMPVLTVDALSNAGDLCGIFSYVR